MNLSKLFPLLFISLISTYGYGQIEIFSDQISMDSVVNSASDELNVVIDPEGQNLYFTRKNHPQNIGGSLDQGDIWISEKNLAGDWTPAYNLRAVNNAKNNLLIGLVNNGETMLLRNGNDFAQSYKRNGQWTKPKIFEVPYFNSKSKDFTASVSSDGRYLLFGMESFGSYGVEDIYVSRRTPAGKWTSPKNLGAKINTVNQEISPFIAADNKTLFFASNGRGGQGSFDIFMSTRLDDTWQNWSEAKNLGTMVNTEGKERSFTFLPTDQYAYLSSTQNSDGYGDLKMVKIQPDIVPVEEVPDTLQVIDIAAEEKIIAVVGKVSDKKSGAALVGAELVIHTEPTNREYKSRTNSDGVFVVNVDEGNSYTIKAGAFRYLSSERVITDLTLLKNDTLVFTLEPVVEGNTITLDHVLFEQGKAILIEGSQKELDLVVEMLKYNPDINIFLAGHTDNQGLASLNVALSQERVQTVTDYLIAQGISKKRISGKGFGGTRPIASNASADTRRLNRRVELTVHGATHKKSTDQ
ncbi:MAG: OmpA family protein [Reichenbachiella sp.]|uniref:OmpA family protein n=1 Tax=Reichenbachiella sp. TaxID=2184521 RepID=UPI003265831F